MSSPWGSSPLAYHRIGRADLGVVSSMDLDPDQVERFLGPIKDILAAVNRGIAHSLVALVAASEIVGFYVVHPDRRDGACWWLGWLAIGRRRQGLGYGRAALASAMRRLAAVEGCRRVRLLVAPDNDRARAMYGQAGFETVGVHSTGELILECELPGRVPTSVMARTINLLVSARVRTTSRRLRSVVGPYAARAIGVVRGPPSSRRGRERVLHHGRHQWAKGGPRRFGQWRRWTMSSATHRLPKLT